MPIMPWIHDALYVGGFAGIVLVARQALAARELSLSGLPCFNRLRWPLGFGALAPRRPSFIPARTSGNTAFDEWRDGEIRRIEAQRRDLEARLQEFENFVDKLKRAKDRETFERFAAEHPHGARPVVVVAPTAGHPEHQPH